MKNRSYAVTTAFVLLVGAALVTVDTVADATTNRAAAQQSGTVGSEADRVTAADRAAVADMDATAAKAAAQLSTTDGDVTASGTGRVAYFVFRKGRNPIDSRLGWYEYRTYPDRPPVLTYKSIHRAGSGDGTKDPCRTAHGWLPSGWYGGTFRTHFDGIINGIVWQLDNKRCKRGTLRTELFIHSEMTPSAGQNCGYEPECWNGPSDYYSAGCVKVRPSHIKAFATRYRSYYGSRAKRCW